MIGYISGSGLKKTSKPVGFPGSGKPDHALVKNNDCIFTTFSHCVMPKIPLKNFKNLPVKLIY